MIFAIILLPVIKEVSINDTAISEGVHYQPIFRSIILLRFEALCFEA